MSVPDPSRAVFSGSGEDPEETLHEADEQDVFADYGVARAFSLAASILDAGQGGLTKSEIRDRVEHYRSLGADQSEDAWERLFSRDKDHLRSSGIAIAEPATQHEDYRYRIDPADYGLPPVQLSEAETLVLARATQLWSGSRTRSWLEQASWALAGPDSDAESHAPTPSDVRGSALDTLQFNLGSDEEFDRLTELATFNALDAIGFAYTARGAAAPQPRQVVLLDYAARGHWYLIGYDLDRRARRVFRLDRIHGPITELKPQPVLGGDDRQSIAATSAESALQSLNAVEDRAELLRGALSAHGQPAPKLPRLAPSTPTRQADPAHRKVERVLSMAAYLLSSDGVRPSELMRRHQISAKQMLKDLLSIQQSGSFGPGQYGEFIDVHPAPPLTMRAFTDEYLAADEPITLAMPSQRTGDVLARPLSLTKPGALSLLIALNTMTSAVTMGTALTMDTAVTVDTAVGDSEEVWQPAAMSLREKITAVLPAGLQAAATSVAAAQQAQTREAEQLRAAIEGGYCVELRYEDASGSSTCRVVEPAQLYIDGPRTYLQAYCRKAQAPRNFLSSRILAQTPLPQEPISEFARELAVSPIAPPQAPRGEGAFDVVLRFSPAAAALADRYLPQRQRSHADGARTISTWFHSREALIRLCLQLGGDVSVLAPAQIRAEVFERAQTELSELLG